MTRRHKAFTLSPLWNVSGVSAVFMVTEWWARLLLAIVACGATIHLLSLSSE